MNKSFPIILLSIFLSGCMVGTDDERNLGYIKYGTIPELNEGKMYAFPILEMIIEREHEPMGCMGFHPLLDIPFSAIDVAIAPLRLLYGALTYPFSTPLEKVSEEASEKP